MKTNTLLTLSAAALLLWTLSACRHGATGARRACGGAAAVTVYVAADGSDANPGTRRKPLRTLEAAREKLRALKQRAGALPAGGVTVELAAGTYAVSRPLALTAEDAGTAEAPVTYRARPGARVVLSGSRTLADWQPVTDAAVLARLARAARGKVFQADLGALGITEYGDLDLDAAWELQRALSVADNQNEDEIGNAMASREAVKSGRTVSPRLELFFNGEPMELSRWPNEGFTKIGTVLGKTAINVRGVVGCQEGLFTYTDSRPERWLKEKHAFVRGYWFRDWALQCHRIAAIDTEKRTLAVAPPYHFYGYRAGQWCQGLNLLCEIDRPGEWMIDREAGLLYFWPPAPLDAGRAEVSMAAGLFTLADTAYVTLSGFTMENARGTAVTLQNSLKCRVVGCTVRNMGNHAVTVVGGQACRVEGCDLSGMGGGGIYLLGGDRATLTHAGHVAENNHIHHFGRWDRMYRPGLFMSGVGLRAAHNLIHHAPHSAILFGGMEHLFEYNEFHNVCQESHDCGAIYAGRSWCLRGNVFQYNYLHHLCGKDGGACNGIYLDDEFSGATVRNNLFYQVWKPVFIGGGRDNVIENNVFVDCPHAFHLDARALGWAAPYAEGRLKAYRETGLLCGVKIKEPPFATRYPEVAAMLDDEPAKPKGNVVRRNLFWQGQGENLRRVSKGQPIGNTWWKHIEDRVEPLVTFEDNLINEDPKFVDEKQGDFRLRDDSPAWKLGFQRIPVEKIGLYPDGGRATWPVAHAVTPLPPLPKP